MAELRAAGEALRSAQQGGQGYREALAARRRAVTALTARAEELLAEGGHAATAATLLRVTKTLEAVAIHGEAGADPPPGRLSEDLAPPGVEALTVFGVAPTASSKPRGRPATSQTTGATGVVWGPRRVGAAPGAGAKGGAQEKAKKVSSRERARVRDAVATAQERLTERRRQERLAADRQQRASAAEERAEGAASEAERALDKARQRLSEASATARRRREEVEQAAAERRRAEEALEAAREALEQLDEDRSE